MKKGEKLELNKFKELILRILCKCYYKYKGVYLVS